MLKKLKRLRVKESVAGIFNKGEILCEDNNFPNHFYSETNESEKELLNINTVCEYLNFDEFFEVIDYKLIKSK
jgi:hypothetical protein